MSLFTGEMNLLVTGICLTLLWVLIAGVNALAAWQTYVQGRYASIVPLLGALFGVAGFFCFPVLRPWFWVPVILDFGSLHLLLAVPTPAAECWRTSHWNLVQELDSTSADGWVARIRLYKGRNFVLLVRWEIRPEDAGWIEIRRVGNWVAEGKRLLLQGEESTLVLTSENCDAEGCFRVEQDLAELCRFGNCSLAKCLFMARPPRPLRRRAAR